MLANSRRHGSTSVPLMRSTCAKRMARFSCRNEQEAYPPGKDRLFRRRADTQDISGTVTPD